MLWDTERQKMATIQGFASIEIRADVEGKGIEIAQIPNGEEINSIAFPVDRADEIIAAIKAAKKEINEAAKA